MSRRAFTLIELLVIVALIGVMVSVAAVSIQSGTASARMKGSVRDVFATVRLARSIALVTQKPCVITFSTKKTDDGCMSHVEIVSSELIKPTPTMRARAVTGEWTTIGGDEEQPAGEASAAGDDATAAQQADSGGETVEEILFAPVSDEVFKDICIKVVMADEEPGDERPGEVNEAKRSMISTFSNVDFLLGAYKEERRKRREEAAKAAGDDPAGTAQADAAPAGAKTGAPAAADVDGEKSLAWQVNGRCEPHTVYVYQYGEDYLTEGWQIRVDRFGAAKTLAPGEVD